MTENNASTKFTIVPAQAKCDAGDLEACLFVGLAAQNGIGVKKDLTRAKDLFDKSCRGQIEAACVALARLTNDATLLVASCKRGFGEACFELSWREEDAKPDVSQSFAVKGCELGYAQSCTRVGQLAENQNDVKAAEKQYSRGCELLDGAGCYSLGRLASSSGSKDSAAANFKKACDLGFPAPTCEQKAKPDQH